MSADEILYNWSYFEVLLVTVGYFTILYFGLAPAFQYTCDFLHDRGSLHRISPGIVSRDQIRSEIGNSIRSIIIFGISAVPIIYLIRNDYLKVLPNTAWNIITGSLILTLWNEVHFFVIHRIMHLRFFMRSVHVIHHRSVTPNVYSVYSFHWFESLLLSTVPLTILPFVPLSPYAIALYPLISVLINYAGHCNYRFGLGMGASWTTFGTRHAEHHYKHRKNYGFAINFFDWLSSKLTQKRNEL